ncbi:hypothetical protein FACS1894120_0240 [Clostridia bacterium]|nr:hypothetical protein FACS1894120_0240 [Clostridia bacterium]
MNKLQKITAVMTAAATLAVMALPASAETAAKPVTLPATIAQLPVLAVPQNVKVETEGFDKLSYYETSGMTVTFDAVAGAKSCNLYVLAPGAKSYVKLDTYYYYNPGEKPVLYVDVPAYTDPAKSKFVFLPETTYKFKVAAVDAKGKQSGFSAAVEFKTPAFAPPRVGNEANTNNRLVVTAPTAALINFRSTAWASSYELAIKVSDGKDYRTVTAADGIKINTTDTAGVTKILSGLKANTSYNIKIRAVGTIGGKTVKSAYGEEFTVETPAVNEKNAAGLVGNYISSAGDFIQIGKDGKATIDFGGSDFTDKNFSYSVTTKTANDSSVITTANLISGEALFTVDKEVGDYAGFRLTQWPYPGEDTLTKTTAANALTPVSGDFAATDYNMSAPVIEFKKDGTGVAHPSGAVSGEKDAYFTYVRKGYNITLKFATDPAKSLHGLKKEVKAQIWDDVTVEKSNDYAFVLKDKNDWIVANIGTRDQRDISSKTPASILAIRADDQDGYFSHYVYTTGPRG